MEIVKLKDALGKDRKKITEAIKKGDIFVYPSDTIYGLGCNTENKENVKKIYQAKNRPLDKPFSVVVPNKEWIEKNCIVSKINKNVIEQLFPGPYTAVLKKKNSGTIGVRIPNNEFTDLIRETGVVFIGTSVNITGENLAQEINNIPEQIKNIVDFAIDAGVLGSRSSRVFDITTDDIKILRA